jgi:hypothetical protein
MLVKNLNGTSQDQNKCKCFNWYAHWQKFSGRTANGCAVIGCSGTDLVDGYVQRDDPSDPSWYVIPICKACSGKKWQSLNITDQVKLVSANVSETCG